MPESNLVACCDLNPDNLKKVKALYPKVEVTQQIDDLLNNPSIDAVVIASSAATHFDLAKKALLAGKHAMVEKPLTLSSDTSRELIDIADKAGCILMVGHLLEYHSAVDYMRGLIDSGELGDIQYLYTQRLNLGQVRTDENALWSLAPHDISIIFYLLGGKEPAEVSAAASRTLPKGLRMSCSARSHLKTRPWPIST